MFRRLLAAALLWLIGLGIIHGVGPWYLAAHPAGTHLQDGNLLSNSLAVITGANAFVGYLILAAFSLIILGRKRSRR